jgi:hypothetical protein
LQLLWVLCAMQYWALDTLLFGLGDVELLRRGTLPEWAVVLEQLRTVWALQPLHQKQKPDGLAGPVGVAAGHMLPPLTMLPLLL